VCLILELLPGSLKALLYKQPSEYTATTSNPSAAKKHASTGATTRYLTSCDASGTSISANEAACTTYITVSDSFDFSNGTSKSSDKSAKQQLQSATHSLASVPKLTMLRVLQISIDIAEGLRYLHEMPLVADPDNLTGMPKDVSCNILEVVQESEGTTSSDLQSTPSTAVAAHKSTKVVHRGELLLHVYCTDTASCYYFQSVIFCCLRGHEKQCIRNDSL
jgi:hypothetical protein